MNRVTLIGCGKLKRPAASLAADLYTGQLFKAAAAHARRLARPWAILSAKHGLLTPGQRVEPYNVAMAELTKAQRAEWSSMAGNQLAAWLDEIGQPSAALEVYAGRPYVEAVTAASQAVVFAPLQGLGIGQRLQWFKQREPAAC